MDCSNRRILDQMQLTLRDFPTILDDDNSYNHTKPYELIE